MAATIVRDDAEAVLREEKHLAVPSIGAQRPAVRERYDRAFAPLLVVDLGAILGFNCAHVSAPFDDGFGESDWFLPRFPVWTDCRPGDGVHRATRAVGALVKTPRNVNNSHPAERWRLCGPLPPSLSAPTVLCKDTGTAPPPLHNSRTPFPGLWLTSGATSAAR